MSDDRQEFRTSELDTNSILGKLGYDYLNPTQLRRTFLLLTRACFRSTDFTDFDGDLANPPIVYDENPKKRTLDVELDYLYDAEKVGEVPSIYVGLGDVNWTRQVIGDYAGHSEDNSQMFSADRADTMLHLRHIAESGDMAYLLANQSMTFYLAMTRLLMSNIPGLGSFRTKQLSKINLVQQEETRHFRVDLMFDITIMFGWHDILEGHRLKEVVMGVAANEEQC